MLKKIKLISRHSVYLIGAWIFIMYFYYFISWGALQNLFEPNVLNDYIKSGLIHLEVVLFGIVFGFLFGMIDILSDRTFVRKKSFGVIILIKSLLYILSIAIVTVVIFLVYFGFGLMSFEYLIESIDYLTPIHYLAFFLYLSVAIVTMNLLIQINKRFGPGILFEFIRGKYHKPREEKRIFMFLDLRGSTTIAKNLGNKVYSQFISNCFYDLTQFIVRYNAQVYQYVGDEVVLSWKEKEGIKNMACFQLFKDYINTLSKRKEHYLKKYGYEPIFKAGIDMGVVTVAEIGEIKREIAYHGDVLNTAARIENMCNGLKRKLLFSESVRQHLNGSNQFNCEYMGSYQLKGLNGKMKIYSLNE